MKQYNGLTIQSGIAYGKVYYVSSTSNKESNLDLLINQKAVLDQAIESSIQAIERLVETSESEYNDTIKMIFEAHKLMVNDPLLIEKAYQYIQEGKNAYEAYQLAANEFIDQFRELTDDYFRYRVIDIQDATDRVLYAIQDVEYEINLSFDSPKIVLVEEMKPSMIFGFEKKHVMGVIAEKGSVNQHASMIAQSKAIPSMLIPNASALIKNNDFVLMDATRGIVIVNPNQDYLDFYQIKGVEQHEL